MAKRSAEKQISQLDPEDDQSDGEPAGAMPVAAAETLAQRKIRKLPSRRGSPSGPPIKTAPLPTATNGTSDFEASKQRLIKLRGLNVSCLKALQDAVAKDAFLDLTEALDKLASVYKQERIKLEGKPSQPAAPSLPTFNFSAPAPAPASSPFGGFAFTPTSQPPAPAKEEPKATMPAPPPSFHFAGAVAAQPPAPAKKKKEEEPNPAMPAPPPSFSFAGAVVTPGSSDNTPSEPSTGGFVFDPSKAAKSAESGEKSLFTLPPSPATAGKPAEQPKEQPKEEKKPASAVPSFFNLSQPVKPSPLRMASNLDSSPTASPPKADEKKQEPASPSPAPAAAEKPKTNAFAGFTFGAAAAPAATNAAPAKPAFSFSAPPSTSAPPSATTEAPASLFNFSSTSKPTAPSISFGADQPPNPSSSFSSVGFAFGSTPPVGKDTPAPTFSFGSSSSADTKDAAAPKVAFGGFGSAAPQVGFSFGGADNNPFAVKPAGESSAPPAFSFKPTPAASATSAEPSADERESNDAPPEVKAGDNPLLGEGEGEENETTEYEARAKLFTFNKDERQWTDKGVGVFKIKKNKETGKCRLLARHATNGKVIMNFMLYATLQVKLGPKSLAFLAFDAEQNGFNARLKVKDDTIAKAFQAALESHVG